MLKSELIQKSKLNYTTEPTLAVGLTGITQLKAITFKSRFTGSKTHIIDRDGKPLPKIKRPSEIKKSQPGSAKKNYSVNKSRIRHIILNWINSQRGTKQLYFFTITFPPCIQDNLAYSLLNSWLTTMRTSARLRNYLWVAERQQNSTIHFHMALSERLNITYANSVMRNLLHYSIRQQKLNWSHTSATRYNGVDIAKNRKTRRVTNFAKENSKRNLSSYLTKYISKSETKFQRQAWQCSRQLSALFTHYTMTLEEFENEYLDYIDQNECLIQCEFFNFFRWAKSPPDKLRQLLCGINQTLQQSAASPAHFQKN